MGRRHKVERPLKRRTRNVISFRVFARLYFLQILCFYLLFHQACCLLAPTCVVDHAFALGTYFSAQDTFFSLQADYKETITEITIVKCTITKKRITFFFNRYRQIKECKYSPSIRDRIITISVAANRYTVTVAHLFQKAVNLWSFCYNGSPCICFVDGRHSF